MAWAVVRATPIWPAASSWVISSKSTKRMTSYSSTVMVSHSPGQGRMGPNSVFCGMPHTLLHFLGRAIPYTCLLCLVTGMVAVVLFAAVVSVAMVGAGDVGIVGKRTYQIVLYGCICVPCDAAIELNTCLG